MQAVSKILEQAGAKARKELRTPVEIEEVDEFPKPSDLYVESRIWKKVKDVVVVVADLKGSTKLNFDKHAQTSARLYEAVTGNMVSIVSSFNPSFVDVQGDGLFALYHGEGSFRRGLCAAITLKTFSRDQLVPAIQGSGTMPGLLPETGIKVGMAAGILAVKKVGVRGTNEPVWAGKPVNWASKCAAHADSDQLIVTRRVFQKFESNDYVTHSCGCQRSSDGEWIPGHLASSLWQDTQVTALPEEDVDCKILRSGWCSNHGDEFCEAILAGKSSREDVSRATAA